MNEFDENIKIISDNICKNIETLSINQRGLISQNILNNLRNLIEAIDQKIYSEIQRIELNNYQDIEKAIKYVASQGNLKFLSRFHKFLQVSVSHYTPDEDSAVRLMLKYYEWMLDIRSYCKNTFDLVILENLEDYPLTQDDSLKEYYEKIAHQLKTANYNDSQPNQRYYIHKSKSFFARGEIYYELTIVSADDYTSKFNRFIVFSKQEIPVYYSIKLNFIDASIEIIDRDMPIRLVNNYKVAIRPIEFQDLAKILGVCKVNAGTKEYNIIMEYLTETGLNFTEVIDLDIVYYEELKERVAKLCGSNNIFLALDKCRELSVAELRGHNIIRYLLLKLRHDIMKQQIAFKNNEVLSNLCLSYKCIPFDDMPYDASLSGHNPALFDIFASINCKGHEEELLSRRIRMNSEQKVQLFTPIEDLKKYGNVYELASKFNTRLFDKHKPNRSLVIEKGKIYIKGYESDTVWIIRELISRKKVGLVNFKSSMLSWIDSNPIIDCDEKKRILPEIFNNSNIAMIYGAAGTGKTTIIKHLAEYFSEESKLFLANTNPAIEHLRREIKTKNSEYSTIASSRNLVQEEIFDIVFIDECSTIDNFAMKDLLQSLKCKLIVLVGDVFQIQSIRFGNWFGLSRYFLPKETIHELKSTFRTQSNNLIGLWKRVRLLDAELDEYLYRNKYSSIIDKTIFSHESGDEVILCLNYDGLYGVNNINKFLQNDNQNQAVSWESWIYKIGDPIIFNEHNRFFPVLYNNLKGWIRNIEKNHATITFTIEVEMSINEFGALKAGFDLLECDVQGHSMIRFSVNNFIYDDSRERNCDQVVPFQVAYAISIHKAQGLEYDSVKIIITNDTEKYISHNIFYTALTRAKKKLKIYWTPETQRKVISTIEPISNKQDAYIIEYKHDMKILNLVKEVKK